MQDNSPIDDNLRPQDAYHELDCQAALRLHKVLKSGRFAFIFVLLAAPVINHPVDESAYNLVLLLSVIEICVAAINVAVFRMSKLLTVIEVLLCAVMSGVIILGGARSLMYVASDFDKLIGTSLALIFSIIVGMIVYWIMYPTCLDLDIDLGNVWVRGGLAFIVIFLVIFAIKVVPPAGAGDLFWILAGILASCLLIIAIIPVAWSLRRAQSLYPLQAIAHNRKARSNGNYSFYLWSHGGNRHYALAYTLCSPLIVCLDYLYALETGPFEELHVGTVSDVANG
jgi:hypothetical protein